MRDLQCYQRVDPSYRQFDERGVAAPIRKACSSTAQGPDGLTLLHLCHLGAHGLAFLTPLSCRFQHPGNLEELRHNPDPEGREASQSESPYLTALPGSEDTGAAHPPVHRGGAGHLPLPALLQTEAFHHLGPAPYLCYGGLWLQ